MQVGKLRKEKYEAMITYKGYLEHGWTIRIVIEAYNEII